MAAPAVVEARLTITAPLCAPFCVLVDTAGAAVEFPPPPKGAPPPPHPHIRKIDKRIVASAAVCARISAFERESGNVSRCCLFKGQQIWASMKGLVRRSSKRSDVACNISFPPPSGTPHGKDR